MKLLVTKAKICQQTKTSKNYNKCTCLRPTNQYFATTNLVEETNI